MGKAKFYAVRKGRNTGVFNSWTDCSDQVNKYSGAEFKSFNSQAEALAYSRGSTGHTSGGSTGYTSGGSTGYTSRGSTGHTSRGSTGYTSRGSTGHTSRGSTGHTSRGSTGHTSSRTTPYARPPARAYQPEYSSYSAPAPRRTVNEPTAEKPVQEIYTDGSCLGNGKKAASAGWGMYWGDHRDSCGPIDKATNNAGELTAINKALREVLATGSPRTNYTIYSDSEYSIKGLTSWTPGWEKKDWKTSTGQPVQNKELFKDNLALLQQAKQEGYNVRLEKIKAHSDSRGNDMADELAKKGAKMSRARR